TPLGPVGGHALGRLDLDGDGVDLVGLALPDAAVGWNVGEVAADRGDDVVVVGERAAGRVDVDPAGAATPDLTPGVRRQLAGARDIAADVPRGDAEAAARPQEEMREVLADAPPQDQRLADRGLRGRHFLLVLQARADRFHDLLDHRGQWARRGRPT